jgi:hypothetical protein
MERGIVAVAGVAEGRRRRESLFSPYDMNNRRTVDVTDVM